MKYIKMTIELLLNYYYDFIRFLKFSTAIYSPHTKAQIEAKIAARTHIIEKGLTFSAQKPGFGHKKIEELIKYLNQYLSSGYGQNGEVFQTALSVLNEYILNSEKNVVNIDWIKTKFSQFDYKLNGFGGVIELIGNEIIKKGNVDFERLTKNRHSIRNFSNIPVDIKTIEHAVEIAQMAPSACNRQSGRVYIIKNQNIKNKILALHKGNAGFGNTIDTLVIVTSELQTFTEIGERYQPYIDGSLFGMTLIYALHSLGLATCTLNWSVTKDDDINLHKIANIPESEAILFFVAIGNYPEKILVTKSKRKKVSEVIRVIT